MIELLLNIFSWSYKYFPPHRLTALTSLPRLERRLALDTLRCAAWRPAIRPMVHYWLADVAMATLQPTVHCCLWEEEALSHGVSIRETGPSFCTVSQLASQASQASELLQSFSNEAHRASLHSWELTEDFC